MRKWLRPPQAVPGISGVSGSGVGDQNQAPVQHVTFVKAATDEQTAGSDEEPLARLPELSDPLGSSPIPRRLTLPEIPEIPETSREVGLRGVSGISGISGKALRLENGTSPEAPVPAPAHAGATLARREEFKKRGAVVALRRPQGDERSAKDWQAFVAKRVGIAELDRGLPRAAALARAFDDCVIEWQYENSVISPLGPCPVCGAADRPNDPLRPIGICGGRAWLHIGCVKSWCTARRAEAVGALAAMGITGPEGNPP
jgi:hypothetical protein